MSEAAPPSRGVGGVLSANNECWRFFDFAGSTQKVKQIIDELHVSGNFCKCSFTLFPKTRRIFAVSNEKI